jgi:hypothetical protein
MQAVAEVCPLVLTHCYAETASLVTEHQPDRSALQSESTGHSRYERVPSAHPYAEVSISIRDQQYSEIRG